MSEQEIVDILKAGGCEVPTYKYRTTAGSTKNRAPRKKTIKKEDLNDTSPSLQTETINALLDSAQSVNWEPIEAPNPLDDLDRYIQGIIDCARLIREWCGDG